MPSNEINTHLTHRQGKQALLGGIKTVASGCSTDSQLKHTRFKSNRKAYKNKYNF